VVTALSGVVGAKFVEKKDVKDVSSSFSIYLTTEVFYVIPIGLVHKIVLKFLEKKLRG